jgi:hypothetical protein
MDDVADVPFVQLNGHRFYNEDEEQKMIFMLPLWALLAVGAGIGTVEHFAPGDQPGVQVRTATVAPESTPAGVTHLATNMRDVKKDKPVAER